MTYSNLILLSGHSRSGTSLSCAILDSHSEIAMSFEVMPTSFEEPIARYISIIDSCSNRFSEQEWGLHVADDDYKSILTYLIDVGGRSFCTWVGRCRRSALDLRNVQEILDEYGRRFSICKNLNERIQLGLRTSRVKLNKFGGAFFGFKAAPVVVDYTHDAKVLYVIRHPLDVFLSMQELKVPGLSVRSFIESWTRFYLKAQKIVVQRNALIFRYEDLINDQQRISGEICMHIGLKTPFNINSYYERSAATSVSSIQVTKNDLWRGPITNTRVRRWEHALRPSDVIAISTACRDIMDRFGYEA